jgi:hypothetical protein
MGGVIVSGYPSVVNRTWRSLSKSKPIRAFGGVDNTVSGGPTGVAVKGGVTGVFPTL